jgi:hypothetical protein
LFRKVRKPHDHYATQSLLQALTRLTINSHAGLQSSLPPELSVLTNLRYLKFRLLPSLTGTVPPELSGK